MGFTVHGHFTLFFTENASDIVLSDIDEPVYLSLSVDDKTLLENVKFIPDAERKVTLLLRQLVRQIPNLAAPDKIARELPKLLWTAKKSTESLTLGCWAMPGGISKSIESDDGLIDFFAQNFLTHQPQIIETTHEQPQWLAFVRPYPYREMKIYTTLYTADGRTFTKQIYPTPDPYTFNQLDTSFKEVWRLVCIRDNLIPIAYDVYGMSTKAESTKEGITMVDKLNHPIGQRYLLRPARYDDQCFGFVNGMGGFDTLMMRGPVVLKPDGENETFVNHEVEKELSNGYTSFWEASTGYIDSERDAAQIQDFLKSTDRWIYHSEKWLRIIVDEYKVEHTPRELNAYTFKYHLAERNEHRYYDRGDLPEVELPIIL